ESFSQKASFIWVYRSTTLILGWILLGGSELEQKLVLTQLHRGMDVIQNIPISDDLRQIIVYLVYPLLQIITSPSTNSVLQKSAASLLQKVEAIVDAPPLRGTETIGFSFNEENFFDSCRGIFPLFSNAEVFLVNFFRSLANPET